jgi:hypothetical protein
MLFIDEKGLADIYQKLMEQPDDPGHYEDMIKGCKAIGKKFNRLYHIMPPTMERVEYTSYKGQGTISVNRTTAEFCRNGRKLDSVIARRRVYDVKKMHLAVLYDDSLPAYDENNRLHIHAKIGCLSLVEGLGKNFDITLWRYGDGTRGPFISNAEIFREVLDPKGGKGKRLDVALEALNEYGWTRKRGERVVMILTGGIPVAGREDYNEDLLINIKTIQMLESLVRKKVKVLYVNIFLEDPRQRRGGYSKKELSRLLERAGCFTVDAGRESNVSDAIFNGLHAVIQKI